MSAAKKEALGRICREHGVLAAYLFGSRADDGRRLLAGEQIAPAGSDLDLAVVFLAHDFELASLVRLQLALEEVFEPLRLDVVPLQRVDPLFQARAIDGHRVFATDSTRATIAQVAPPNGL